MRGLAGAMAAAALAAAPAAAGAAGVQSDDLAKCLVRETSEADRALLMQWLFSALSAGPAVSGLASVTPAQRQDYNRKAGRLFERLMADDCRAETVAALKHEGEASVGISFGVLGEVAMDGLMSDPKVRQEMAAVESGMNMAWFDALFAEAGLPPPPH